MDHLDHAAFVAAVVVAASFAVALQLVVVAVGPSSAVVAVVVASSTFGAVERASVVDGATVESATDSYHVAYHIAVVALAYSSTSSVVAYKPVVVEVSYLASAFESSFEDSYCHHHRQVGRLCQHRQLVGMQLAEMELKMTHLE